MKNQAGGAAVAYVTGMVNQQLLLQNEYLVAESKILRAHLPARLRLSDPERCTLAEIAKRVGRKALKDIASVAKPDTILAWYRRQIAQKFDGSRQRAYPGRPRVSAEIEALVVRLARENRSWGYDRIVGALANVCHDLSDQTISNILRRHGIALVRFFPVGRWLRSNESANASRMSDKAISMFDQTKQSKYGVSTV